MHRRTDGPIGTVISYTRYEVEDGFDVDSMEFHDFFGSLDWRIDSRHDLRVSFTHLRERSNYDESNLTPQEFKIAPRRKKGRFGQEYDTIKETSTL